VRFGQEVQALPRAFELSAEQPAVRVVAGILRDAVGRILVSQRLPWQHMAGRWEFPGGKLSEGESQRTALARELDEELGIEVRAARPLIEIHHAYADRRVVLHVWCVERFVGDVRGREGQALQWLELDALSATDLLEADQPILAALALPDLYLITGDVAEQRAHFLARLEAALDRGIELVQLRAPQLAAHDLAGLAAASIALCRERRARLLINGDPRTMVPLARAVGAQGVHVPARYLNDLRTEPRPRDLLLGVSCHDEQELRAARDCFADFALLGPVQSTPTHPDREPLGWTRFGALARGAGLPVYALGGVGPADLTAAWEAGAQGVAAIRALWGGV
jgi:8-oxo-dGTP diphosphatase